METIDQVPQETALKFEDKILEYLEIISKWGKFLAILGFIGSGFLVLFGIVFLIFGTTFNELNNTPGLPATFSSIVGVSYLLTGVLSFFPALFLYRFAEKMIFALEQGDQESCVTAFGNLKSLFKFTGIMTIVGIGIFILAFIGAIFAGMFMAM
jgi:hypothetical protein